VEGAVEVVVGLPRSLTGREGPAAVKVRAFARETLTCSIRYRCGCATSG
jgi:RNase H-fold protein (predicted Holliday junction resolvase)